MLPVKESRQDFALNEVQSDTILSVMLNIYRLQCCVVCFWIVQQSSGADECKITSCRKTTDETQLIWNRIKE